MALFSKIHTCIILLTAAASLAACNKLEDAVDTARTRIVSHLRTQGIYERDNVPENVASTSVNGYYDVVGGAYRYITNEDRDNRASQREINVGDSISFYFDARIFSSSYDNSATYYTNITSRIEYISNNNPQFDISDWPTEPKRIKVGDGSILKAIQNSLPSCRVGDVVRIFLPPDVAYEDKQVGVVPGRSTLVFELTDIVIIE